MGTVSIQNNIFNFTLINVSSYLESTFSTMATNELKNTIVECTSPRDTVKTRIIGIAYNIILYIVPCTCICIMITV